MYREAIEYIGWAHRLCAGLKGDQRSSKDQLLRASQSIPLNIAEGNGKASEADSSVRLASAKQLYVTP